jgi:hypothetical protein
MKNFLLKSLDAFAIYLLAYFAPTFTMLLAIGFLVFCDFITGMMASKKRGEEIRSKKMRPTIMKGFGYMVAILVAHVFQKHFIPNFEVMKIIAGLIAFIELKSLDENFKDITGKSLFGQFLKK